MPLRQFPLVSTGTNVGCGLFFMVVCRYWPGYSGSSYTTKTFLPHFYLILSITSLSLNLLGLNGVYPQLMIFIFINQLQYIYIYQMYSKCTLWYSHLWCFLSLIILYEYLLGYSMTLHECSYLLRLLIVMKVWLQALAPAAFTSSLFCICYLDLYLCRILIKCV